MSCGAVATPLSLQRRYFISDMGSREANNTKSVHERRCVWAWFQACSHIDVAVQAICCCIAGFSPLHFWQNGELHFCISHWGDKIRAYHFRNFEILKISPSVLTKRQIHFPAVQTCASSHSACPSCVPSPLLPPSTTQNLIPSIHPQSPDHHVTSLNPPNLMSAIRILNHGLPPCKTSSFLLHPSARALRLAVKNLSEPSFLLVENYNLDCSFWSSDRKGIFGTKKNFFLSFHWFSWLDYGIEEEIPFF